MTSLLTSADLDRCPWASCGPTALAALLEKPLDDLHAVFPNHTASRTWTNLAQMQGALRLLDVRAWPTESAVISDRPARAWPRHGLVLLQLRGPWDAKPINHPAQLQRTHLAAVAPLKNAPQVREPWIFDVNALDQDLNHGWLPRGFWETRILAPLIASHKRASGGWWVRAGIEVVSPG